MTARALPLGPLMLDVAGTGLTADDRRRLTHPLTGGVVLFTRNYSDPGQLLALTAEIHGLRNPPLKEIEIEVLAPPGKAPGHDLRFAVINRAAEQSILAILK